MAIPTEENSVVANPIRVIAVKLPFDLQERVLTFPFLHRIRTRYPEAELHFITPKKNIEVLNLLPFTAYYHEFDEDEIRHIFDAHRFCANAKIFNVDLFISLTNSFSDACLGLFLRAKKRLGFSDNWKTLVLNQKIPRPRGHHICEDFLALYKEHIGGEIDTRTKVMSRELTPVIEKWDQEPYIAVNLSPIRNTEVEDEWLDLISRFENQRFVFFASEDPEKVHLYVQNFIAKLPKKNFYEIFVSPSWINIAKMVAFAKGVITYNGPAASISAYTGSKTIILFDYEDPQRFGPFYFLADTMFMTVTDPTVVKAAVTSGALKERVKFDMETVSKKTFEFLRLNPG